MNPRKLINAIAMTLAARENCERMGNGEWYTRHGERLNELEKLLPSGSGFDAGTTIGDESTSETIVLHTSYHFINDDGYYCGWYDFRITVRASLVYGFEIESENDITPEDIEENSGLDSIPEYVDDVISESLNWKVIYHADGKVTVHYE